MDTDLLQDMFYAAPELWYMLGAFVGILILTIVCLLLSYLKTKQQIYFLNRDRERYAETLYASKDGYFAFIYPDDRINDPRENITERCSRRLAVILGLGNGTKTSFSEVMKNFYKEDAKKIEKYVALLKKEGTSFEDYFELKNSQQFIRLEGIRINGVDGSIYCDMIWFRDITLETSHIKNLEEEQAKTNKKYWLLHDMMDNIPLALWLRDSDSKIVYCNKKYAELSGLTSKDEVILNQTELTDTKGLSLSKSVAKESLETKKSHKIKGSLIMEGNRLAVEITESPFYAGQNLSENYCAGFLTNISELDDLQRNQKQQQNAQLMILEKLGTAFAVFNRNMVLNFHNDAFVNLWGLKKEQISTNFNYISFLDSARDNRCLPEVPDYKAFKKEEQKVFDHLIEPISDLLHLPNGKTFYRTRAPYPLGGVIFAYEDISDRLAATSAYNQIMSVQNEILNNLKEGVLIFGASGRLMFFNDAYMNLWQASRDFLLSEPTFDELLDSQKSFFESDKNWEVLKKQIENNILNITTKSLTLNRKKDEKLQINVTHLSDESLMIVYNM